MEKILSVEERIKKAEEIYNRRGTRNGQIGYTNNVSKNKNFKQKQSKALKKMLFQIIVCLFIYTIFYTISNGGYIFSEDFKNNVNSLINTQTDFNKILNDSINFFSSLLSTSNGLNVDNSAENQQSNESANEIDSENKEKESLHQNNKDENPKQNESNENEKNQNDEQTPEQSQSNEDIGGAVEDNITENNSQNEKSQMEIDAENIKNSISFEIPLEGRISSTFGLRNPTTASVPKNHTGLDIAANTGTVIKSATDGTVILASSNGDYGKHYKIEIGDVIIIYGHCSKLYLKEGDLVKKGQSIAEVGSTGNSTGPHLHFEIRKDGRPVDPQLILDL